MDPGYGNYFLDLRMSKIQQSILSYPAIFEPAREGGYNVSFPAFPGCVTFGKSFEDAKAKAQELLELWLEELSDTKQEIPAYQYRPIIDEIQVTVPAKAKIHYASHHRQKAY